MFTLPQPINHQNTKKIFRRKYQLQFGKESLKMDNWNFSIAEDTNWNFSGDNYARTDDLLYSDFEDVDQIISYVCEKDEIPWPKHQDSDANDLPERGLSTIGNDASMSQYAVHMEVDDSDIAAVVKSALNPMINGNNSNEFEVLENMYSCEVKRNQPAECMISSMYDPGQMQILEDHMLFSSSVPCDQPCISGLSSKQNHWGTTYTSSDEYIGNPQFQPESTLPLDQCMGRFFDPSSKPPFAEPVEETIRPCHGQQVHDALVAEYIHEQASLATSSRVEKEHRQTRHENESGSKVEDLAFDTDLSVQENSCMEQVFSNAATAEATNLLQLHNVTNEMDVGTKRCISESLYRLARSTIRRPDLSDLSNGNSEIIVERRYQSIKRTKRIAEGCMSTDTNILDQSIAKLLFYKPLDLAATSSAEAMLMRSGMLIGIPL